MFNIYIKTPPINNSIYIPHLVEHSLWWKIKTSKDYFDFPDEQMSTDTYYTILTLYSDSKKDLKKFLELVKKPLEKEKILYEKKRIKEENNEISFSQVLCEKIWKKFYWKSYNYNWTQKVNIQDIIDYHEQFYINWEFFICEENKNFEDFNLENFSLKLKEKFNLSLRWEKWVIFIFENKILNWYFIKILDNFLENFFRFEDIYKNYKYNSAETIYWNFPDFVYISIWKNDIERVKNVSDEFIKNFIDFKLKKFEWWNENNFDWVSIMNNWFTFSDKTKKEFLENFWKFFQEFKNFL